MARSSPGRALQVAAAAALCALAGSVAAQRAQAPAAPSLKLSSVAERVYSAARPRLLQIRTLLASAGRQSSIGSGFLVSASGLAVTNYHVVSQFALEPATYRLEYTAADGGRGSLQLMTFDVANDIAVVKMDRPAEAFFEFDSRSPREHPMKGERLYSMGNPLDLGFTIVEGTFNGTVERSYNERIHFSGALNPGMSGGPTVSAASRIVGVNVAKRLDGELVSFLVPARFAAELVQRAASAAPLSPQAIRAEIGRQLAAWQEGLYRTLAEQAPRKAVFGPYEAPESPATLFHCWAHTNADEVPQPRATVNTTSCYTNASVFLSGDLNTGQIRTMHAYLKSRDLNDFQFAAFLSWHYQALSPPWNLRRHTRTRCHEAVVEGAQDRPLLRAVWCARAYREFDGLYDVSVLAVTQDRPREALVAKLSMQGVAYDNAMQLAQRFLREVRLVR